MRIIAATALLVLSGCGVVAPMSASARAQETATEMNTNARFGRLELATESVDPTQREAYLARHKLWGNVIRVADYEMSGFKLKDTDNAETLVQVSWYRIETGDLKTTVVRQKWKQFKGDWRLMQEERAEGDAGLLGEPPALMPAPSNGEATAKKAAMFPTIRLGSTENAPEAAKADD